MNKNYLEIHVKGNGLSFKSGGNNLLDLNIPTNILDNMEILDPLGLEKLITDSIKAGKVKAQNANLFLSNDIIFNKIVKTPEEESAFFDQIPIEPNDLIKKTVDSSNTKVAVAVNNKFINNLKLVLEKSGFKIYSIVPEVESIQDLVDFGSENESKKEFPLFKVALTLFVIVLISLGVLFFFIKKPLIKIEIAGITPTPTSTPQATPIPSLNKSDIKIQILNKTKIAGLAKKVGDTLSDFPNIELGNIDGLNTQTTDITFSPLIGEKERNGIYNILVGMFSKVASSEAEIKNGFDITIEVGKTSWQEYLFSRVLIMPKTSKGFTLIEMLVVLGILAVLITIVLVAINPAAQLMSARNTKRSADVTQILNAIDQYFIVHGSFPSGITTSTKTIKSAAGAGNVDICSDLVDEFIAAMPSDPSGGTYTDCTSYDTGYTVIKSSGGNNRITVSAPSAESATISVTR